MSLLLPLLRPLYDSIFSTLPFRSRWRLFVLQPLSLISASLTVTIDLVPAIPCSLDPDSQRRIRKSYSVHTAERERQAPQTAAFGHVRRGLHRGSSGVQRAFDVRSRRTKQVWWL